MRGQSTRSTTWTCDACDTEVILTDGDQDVPPPGWRLIGLWPKAVNTALEPPSGGLRDVKRAAICQKCIASPISIAEIFDA